MTASIRRYIGAALVLGMVLGPAPAAGAQARGQTLAGRATVSITLEFRDLKDAEWALKFIEKMKHRAVIQGFEDGTFRPHAALAEAEAIALAARLLGLEDEARVLAGEPLEFTGADQVQEWARGYVALALREQWVDPADLQPNRSASRLWTAVMLVKALGLEADAEAAMSQPLASKDADLVPAALAGYVAVALDQNLITGFEDGTFRPFQPITRAQMAALLDRIDERGSAPRTADEIEGTLVSVAADGESMTVRVAGEERVIPLAPDASVYVDEKPGDLAGVPAGAKFEAKLGEDGRAVFVAVEIEDEEERSKVHGIVVRVDPAGTEPAAGATQDAATVSDAVYGGGAGSITVLVRAGRERGAERTYGVDAAAEIKWRGRQIPLSEIQPGRLIELIVAGEIAHKVHVHGGGRPEKERKDDKRGHGSDKPGKVEVEGVLVSLELPTADQPGAIVIQTGYGEQEFVLAAEAEVEGDAESLAELTPGDRVEVEGKDGVVREIEVRRTAVGESRGR